MDYKDVLTFWFEETVPEQHYKKDASFDAVITERFLDTYWEIVNGTTTTWRETAAGRLAEIIVLDQFARNMFRGEAQAFAADSLALELAREALVLGEDKKVQKAQRGFFYLPYMHSESLAVHEEAHKIFTDFGDANMLEYEIKHQAVLEEFGRYPHRNAALGRTSTPAEIAWLAAGGGF